MDIAVEKFAVICFFLIGFSHIVQPRAWAEFFIRLREKGTTGSFINAWIHFPPGALIVALSQGMARDSRDSNGAGVCVGLKRFYLFRFSAIRIEGDGASAPRTCLGVCRCRDRNRCAGRFVTVFVDKQRRTVLKLRRPNTLKITEIDVTSRGTRINLSRFGGPPDFNAALARYAEYTKRTKRLVPFVY